MKLMKLKKTAMLAAAVSVIALSTAMPAQALPRSHYDYALTLETANQRNFAQSMVKNYNNVINVYKTIVNKYGHYSWAASYVKTYNWFVAERDRYEALLEDSGAAEVTVVNTSVQTNSFTMTDETAEHEASRVERIVEEESDRIVNVYLEVTVVFEKTVTTKNMQGIFTTYYYSDDTKRTEVGSRELSRSNEVISRTVVEREFMRSYELAVEPEVIGDGMGTPTANVLTVEEYLARDDVALDGTDTYRDAVFKVNSRVNPDYITRESGLAPYGRTLETIGAPDAWARGWTGKGSTLAILDTGIDIDHSEFAGRIVGAECFIRGCENGSETIADGNSVSHGTHVAGIAAAALDGVGTTGVAPDANLLIGKVAYNWGFYDFSTTERAMTWAIANGADAINMSGNYNVDITYKNSVVGAGNGVYRSTDTRSNFATDGYSNLMTDNYILPGLVNAMQDNETVLVMSAGNQGLAYPTFPAHYAIAEDDNGELLLDGRAIVVGNWDIRLDRLATSSNAAGTMCFEFNTDGSCTNDRRVSDFYIMAPGMWVASTDKDGEYRTNSGTSMAAPAVTGAVGVVHQMWPYMKGENIVQLLLDTADKTVTGYDVNVHGQGLLDLNAATLPQGALGIPTTGRVEGARNNVSSGTIALQGGNISALENVMAVDDYDRNFYFNGNDMVAAADTRTADPTRAARMGFAPDYYFGYGAGHVLQQGPAALNISTDGSMSIAYTTENNLMFGVVNENGSFLGNVADNAMMRVTGANTVYAGYNMSYALNTDTELFGNATIGVTNLSVDSNSMMQAASTVLSNSATLGIRRAVDKKTTVGFVASMPVAITNGNATFQTATGVSASGDVEYASMSSDISAQRREVDLGMFHSYNVNNMLSIDTHVEARVNYAGTNRTAMEFGAALKFEF